MDNCDVVKIELNDSLFNDIAFRFLGRHPTKRETEMLEKELTELLKLIIGE